jgi:hypothetical protein
MTEDEEFELLEKRIHQQERSEKDTLLNKAVTAAYQFTHEAGSDLGIFTLRKAFEMGFIAGHNAATGEKHE